MILCYALLRGGVRGLPPGLEGASTRTVPMGGMDAVVSEHAERVPADRAAALAHARVVAAAAEAVPALPVRLGSWHSGLEHLQAEVEADAEPLRATLDRVGGRHEVVVRAPAPAAVQAPADVDPAGYLRARRDAERATADVAAAVAQRLREQTAHLDALAAEVRETTTPRGPERAFLVDRARRDELLAAARDVAAPDGLVVGGPWPPYSFADPVGAS